MKRSKTLLVANILSTIYSVYLLWAFGSTIIEVGGADYIESMIAYFELTFDLLGMSSPTMNFLFAIVILLCVHIVSLVLGCLIGWIAYISKKSGIAKFAAILYMIGTICFPVYLLWCLPITIIGFIGSGKQKTINNKLV